MPHACACNVLPGLLSPPPVPLLMLQGAAAAAGVARAATKLSLSGAAAAQGAAAPAQPHLADKERLAAAIAVKEKVLTQLQKQQASADPATRARLQHKLDKLMGTTTPAPTAAAAAVKPPSSTAAGLAATALLKGVHKQQQKQKLQQKLAQVQQQQQQRQPLAGIAPVLAVTAAEQVRAALQRVTLVRYGAAGLHTHCGLRSTSCLHEGTLRRAACLHHGGRDAPPSITCGTLLPQTWCTVLIQPRTLNCVHGCLHAAQTRLANPAAYA